MFCKQTLETLIRRRVLWRLIWICAVCLCPTKRTLGLYGLIVLLSSAASNLGLLSLPLSHKKDAMLIWVNCIIAFV